MDESIWTDLKGRELTDRGLAVRLHAYEIGSKQIRVGEWGGKGYAKADFLDAWRRYLPRQPPQAKQAKRARKSSPKMFRMFRMPGQMFRMFRMSETARMADLGHLFRMFRMFRM